ncbi:hypothetical protein FOXYSP1_11891 [Fusarium oxysporum f. sp. phaseoli]
MGLPIGQTIWCFLPKNIGIRAKAHPFSLANRLTSVSNSQAAAQMRRSLLEFRRLGQVADKRPEPKTHSVSELSFQDRSQTASETPSRPMSRSFSERRMLRPFKSPSSVHERSHRAVPQRNSDPGSTVETVPKNARPEHITNPKSRTRPILDEIVRHKERRLWRFGLFPALICSDLLNLISRRRISTQAPRLKPPPYHQELKATSTSSSYPRAVSQENSDLDFTVKTYLEDRKLRRAQDSPITNVKNSGRNGPPPGSVSNAFPYGHSQRSANSIPANVDVPAHSPN